MIVDGTGRRVIKTKIEIAFALKGNTSLVQSHDEGLVMLYDLDNREINIILFDSPTDTFNISEIDSAVEKFLELYNEHYGKN